MLNSYPQKGVDITILNCSDRSLSLSIHDRMLSPQLFPLGPRACYM